MFAIFLILSSRQPQRIWFLSFFFHLCISSKCSSTFSRLSLHDIGKAGWYKPKYDPQGWGPSLCFPPTSAPLKCFFKQIIEYLTGLWGPGKGFAMRLSHLLCCRVELSVLDTQNELPPLHMSLIATVCTSWPAEFVEIFRMGSFTTRQHTEVSVSTMTHRLCHGY